MVRTEVPIASRSEQMYITRQSGNEKRLSLAGSGRRAEETAKRNSHGEPYGFSSKRAMFVVRCALARATVVIYSEFGADDEQANRTHS